MKVQQRFPQIGIEVSREEIDQTGFTTYQVPDEKWRYVDKKGHGHFWDGDKLPTLEWVVTGTQWVGDEYDGEEYEVGEHRCKQCAEVVKPGKRSEQAKPLLGPVDVTVTVNDEVFRLSQDEYAASVDGWLEALRAISGQG